MVLGVLDILGLSGFGPTAKSRLVRHQHNIYPVDQLRRHGWLEIYQAYQGRPVFHHVDRIVSFYGMSGTRAGFYGVYEVRGHTAAKDGLVLDGCPWSEEWHRESRFFYFLERDTRFEDLRDRLVIDWGSGTRSWVQKVTNKTLLEVLESGRRLPPFEDYLEFSLSYAQLQDLFANEEAHREWRAHLSAVAGIYLILAEASGDLYVGSAYGEEGIWGRWREYARSGHGGNALLRDLIARDPTCPSQFRFSLLQILPKTMASKEVCQREAMYKTKLGSRATGLNLN
jgi:hypothetical protein